MEKITELLNNFSLEKYIPKLDTLTGWVQWLVSLAVRVGPICILVLGLIYLLCPPKEANRKAGFRTYFGMGSIFAWQFTQRLAGILMVPTGLILTIIAYVKAGKFAQMDLMEMGTSALSTVKGQVICALIIYVVIFVLTAVLFTRQGKCRFDGQVLALMQKLLPKNAALPFEEAPTPEKEEDSEEDSRPITADDIVIEDL